MRALLLSMISLGALSFSPLPKSSLEQSEQRIKDHLLIKDYTAALSELKIYLVQFPQSKELQTLMVKALSEAGRGLEAFKHWTYIAKIYEDIKYDDDLIESIAWAMLNQAEYSSQYVVNISSMIGASLTKDAKAVAVLHRYLKSTDAYLRMVAVQLSSQYGDQQLIEELKRMLTKESVWYVRLEIIRALGRFQCEEVATLLKEMLASKKSSIEEMAVAAEALMAWYDHMDRKELLYLLYSSRAGLRYLGCEIIGYINSKEYTQELMQLMKDSSAEVRMGVLNTLSIVGIDEVLKEEVLKEVERLTQDPQSSVAITACRLLMFYKPQEAEEEFMGWLTHENVEYRRVAAAALARSGPRGREIALKVMQTVEDPFVRVNLAYSLLGYQECMKPSAQVIAQFLENVSENIMLDGRANPMLRVIAPSRIRHTPEVSQYPEAVDQHVRLHLLNILAMMRYQGVEASIKKYLRKQYVGMTYAASAALIAEGAEDSLEIIQSLLKDEDEMIRVQAALVLAVMGGDKRAISVLEEAYPKVAREVKMQILEALGHIGSKSSIPFLMKIFEDPFNVMRMIAASSIIQCLYH